jgi:hypothetical protein
MGRKNLIFKSGGIEEGLLVERKLNVGKTDSGRVVFALQKFVEKEMSITCYSLGKEEKEALLKFLSEGGDND